MKSHSYNVVLLPPSDVFQKAINLSNSLKNYFNLEFVLDGKTRYPHITLYQLTILDSNYDKLILLLDQIFTYRKKISSKKTNLSSNGRFISIDVFNSKHLNDLHSEVVKKSNVLRKNTSQILIKGSDKVDYLKQFGSNGVFENFKPHITITRLKNEKDVVKALRSLKVEKESVIFEKAAIGELADHGTVTKIIKEYNLS